jgi:hypothetical protein
MYGSKYLHFLEERGREYVFLIQHKIWKQHENVSFAFGCMAIYNEKFE